MTVAMNFKNAYLTKSSDSNGLEYIFLQFDQKSKYFGDSKYFSERESSFHLINAQSTTGNLISLVL